MRQKKVKQLRKEAIMAIQNSGKRIPVANYEGKLWSNPYNSFIRQFRKGV